MTNNNNHASETTPNREVVPAVEVQLTGQHLIEASAGTGKTWTLTGIVLRLLIEARRAPEQIIATTFTRAAAAEMRQRIHDRLVDFYQLLQWVDSLSGDIKHKQTLYPEVLQVQPENQEDTDKHDKNKIGKNTNDVSSADTLNQDMTYDQKIIEEKKDKARNVRANWLIDRAKNVRLDGILQDPVNLFLLQYLLDNTKTYPLTEAIKRTALVLTSLDKLFVGTLDSLAQKWLTEYSSETGHQQGMSIIEDASIEQVTDSIIHDELRQFQSRMYRERPKLYDLMERQGQLTCVDDHKKYVSRSLNFISAPIDEVTGDLDFDFDVYEQKVKAFSESDLIDIQPYLNPDYRKSQGFNGRSSLHTRFEYITEVHQVISERGVKFQSYISDDADKLLNSLLDAQFPNDTGKIKNFNKNKEKEHHVFFSLPPIQKLMNVLTLSEALNTYVNNVLANLNRHIVLAVRERLPIILEERGETTFGLQMVRLNQALTGKQGAKLARYIRHHYPVALIDESQDINGEQAIMIESIYLSNNQLSKRQSENKDSDKHAHQQNNNHEFLLLVGDPKQAIYGFRGGDVANYNDMKAKFDTSHIWSLDTNRRSNERLINALNHWFNMPDSNSNQNRLAQLGTGIYYHHIKAHNKDSKLSWFNEIDLPEASTVNDQVDVDDDKKLDAKSSAKELLSDKSVSVIHLPNDDELDFDEHEVTACHIAALLNSGQTLNGKQIQPSDIGVLGRAKKDLKRVEDELVKLNVPTLTTSDVSIFETAMAEDVAALLNAMLHPYRHDMINRVLTSNLYGLSIHDVKLMMTDHVSGLADGLGYHELKDKDAKDLEFNNKLSDSHKTGLNKSYQDFITYLKEGATRWQQYGILSAMHYLLDKSPIHPKGVWQSLASQPAGDRYIMDLRHVMDILAEYGIGLGEYELLAWFKECLESAPNSDWAKQYPLPTESGVQLMTIHKSKGLEFPIVYVLGMGDASRRSGNKEKYGLYLYNVQQRLQKNNLPIVKENSGNLRRFSPVKGTQTDESYFTDLETQEDFDEFRRLGYVAFTRASEQLYIVLHDPKNRTGFDLKPVFYWFESPEPRFELPDRLKGIIGMLRGETIKSLFENGGFNKLAGNSHSALDARKTPNSVAIDYVPFEDIMSVKNFYGWAKTSFTALARQLDEATQPVAVVDERMDDATPIDTRAMMTNQSSDETLSVIDTLKSENDIRFSFIRGANAGTFLHKVFENIDFKDQSMWSGEIDKAISKFQIPSVYSSKESTTLSGEVTPHNALQNWIIEVIDTPLLASNVSLKDIDSSQRVAELGFNMGLKEGFKVEDINKLYQNILPDNVDKHIKLTPQNRSQIYRYLRGEIDLVYQHNGKFYVVDYKSNHLGNSLSSYSKSALENAMSKAGYWLQAAIYQVALHRFLSLRIADYIDNEEQYLGPVEYVFLRGVYNCNEVNGNNQGPPTNHTFGLVTWDIPLAFVKALDSLLGQPDNI